MSWWVPWGSGSFPLLGSDVQCWCTVRVFAPRTLEVGRWREVAEVVWLEEDRGRLAAVVPGLVEGDALVREGLGRWWVHEGA